MRTLLFDGSYYARTVYTAYATHSKAKGTGEPGPHHLLHAFLNKLFAITRTGNVGPHNAIVVLRAPSEDMPPHFQAQQAGLPAQLRAFGVQTLQLPDKRNIETLCQLAMTPELNATGITFFTTSKLPRAYISPNNWYLLASGGCIRDTNYGQLFRELNAGLLPTLPELPAFATLQEMPKLAELSAAKLLERLRPLSLFTGLGQNPAALALAAQAKLVGHPLAERCGPNFWAQFQAAWGEIFPPAYNHAVLLPRPTKEAILAELHYYKFDQLVGYAAASDWTSGLSQ